MLSGKSWNQQITFRTGRNSAMQYQPEFWPAPKKATCQQHWKNLSSEEQAERIASLARLIAKTICPLLIDKTQENNHEQSR
jgi:hypothetical protein